MRVPRRVPIRERVCPRGARRGLCRLATGEVKEGPRWNTDDSGKSGLEVSTLCLGGMTFGEADEKSFMHQVGSDADTAMAGDEPRARRRHQLHRHGRRLRPGRALASASWASGSTKRRTPRRGRARDEVSLPHEGRARTGRARRACASCARWRAPCAGCKTDRIDLYQIHMQDVNVPEEEIARALDDLVRAGKVLYLGCSNYAAYRMMESLWICDRCGLDRFVALQAQYSLIERNARARARARLRALRPRHPALVPARRAVSSRASTARTSRRPTARASPSGRTVSGASTPRSNWTDPRRDRRRQRSGDGEPSRRRSRSRGS